MEDVAKKENIMEPALMEPEANQEESITATANAFSKEVGELLCHAHGLPLEDAMGATHAMFSQEEILAATMAALKDLIPLEDAAVYLLAIYCKRIADDIKSQGFLKSLIKRRANLTNHQKARQVWTIISPIWQSMQLVGKTQFNQFRKDFLELQSGQSS